MVVNGVLLLDGVNTCEDVAKVAVSEVFAVGLDEGFALAEGAARIGLEVELAEVRPQACAATTEGRADLR